MRKLLLLPISLLTTVVLANNPPVQNLEIDVEIQGIPAASKKINIDNLICEDRNDGACHRHKSYNLQKGVQIVERTHDVINSHVSIRDAHDNDNYLSCRTGGVHEGDLVTTNMNRIYITYDAVNHKCTWSLQISG